MIKQTLVLISIILTLFLTASISIAAPTIDGVMKYTDSSDWGNLGDGVTDFSSGFNDTAPLTNVSVEDKYAGNDESDWWRHNNRYYDVEELGIFIDNNMLYIGLQTDYNFICESDVKKGDFMFELEKSDSDPSFVDNGGESGSVGSPDFAFRFSLNGNGSADMTLYAGNFSYTSYGTDFNNYNTPWGVSNADDKYTQTFTEAGAYTYGHPFLTTNGKYTIEAAIDLNQLSDSLTSLFSDWSKEYTHVTMYWQMECGNDFLAARSAFGYTPPESPVPEPATLLLFGMGLLGAGAYGRRKI